MQEPGYHRPTSLIEALECRAAIATARVVAGGTDLLVQERGHLDRAPLLSLRAVPELRTIDSDAQQLRIGACVPLHEIAQHEIVREEVQELRASIEVLGSRQLRNVATMGGNLCNASPGADTALPLLVAEGRCELRSLSGTRGLSPEDFFVSPGRTALRPNEILTGVILPRDGQEWRSSFQRKGRVRMDLAIASLAMRGRIEGKRVAQLRIAAGAVAPVPLRLHETEQRAEATALDPAAIEALAEHAMAEVRPIDDVRASASYRRSLIRVFVKRAFEELLQG